MNYCCLLIFCSLFADTYAMTRSPGFYFPHVHGSDETVSEGEGGPNNILDAVQSEIITNSGEVQPIVVLLHTFGPSNSSEALRGTRKIVGIPSSSSDLLAEQAQKKENRDRKERSNRKKKKRKRKLEVLSEYAKETRTDR